MMKPAVPKVNRVPCVREEFSSMAREEGNRSWRENQCHQALWDRGDLTSQLPSTGHLPSLHRVLTHSQGNRWQGWASQGWETGQRCPSWHLGAVQKVKLDMIRMNLGLLEKRVWESLMSLCKFILEKLSNYLAHLMVMSLVT